MTNTPAKTTPTPKAATPSAHTDKTVPAVVVATSSVSATAQPVKADAKPLPAKIKSRKPSAPTVRAAKTKPVASKPAAKVKSKSVASKPAAKTPTKKSPVMNNTVETMTAATNDAVKENLAKTMNVVNEATTFHKDTVEAVIASATITGKGLETVNANAVAFAKTAMEDSVTASKAFASAKSVQEIFEIQSNYAKSAMDSYMAELNKTSEIFSGLLKESAKPLNNRVAAVVELAQSQR